MKLESFNIPKTVLLQKKTSFFKPIDLLKKILKKSQTTLVIKKRKRKSKFLQIYPDVFFNELALSILFSISLQSHLDSKKKYKLLQ